MFNMFGALFDDAKHLVGQISDTIVEATADAIGIEKQWVDTSEAQAFYKHIAAREDVQNLLIKYRLQFFQIREVNEECVRRANMASTRMGRVQQTFGEQCAHIGRLHTLLAHGGLDTMSAQLEEGHRQIREIERHIIQTEMAMAALEELAKPEIEYTKTREEKQR